MEKEYNTNSEIGSLHWFNTLASQVCRMGEYIEKNTGNELLQKYGEEIKNISKYLMDNYKEPHPKKEALSVEEDRVQLSIENWLEYIEKVCDSDYMDSGMFDHISGIITRYVAYASQFTAKDIEWISVKDRMPKLDYKRQMKPVIIAGIGSVIEDQHYVVGAFYDGKNFTTDEGLNYGSVTHWTPLPSPPKTSNPV